MNFRDKGPIPQSAEGLREFLQSLTEEEMSELCGKMAKGLIRDLERGDPATVCFMHQQMRELEQCATIDKDGNLVYDLDQRGKMLEFKR